ncbi:MAG: DMT family transporter [Alphaproteobacteria bacterium]
MSLSPKSSGAAIPFWLACVFLFVAAVSWAGSSVAGRAASGNVPPFTLSFVRWLIVVPLFLLIGWRQTWADRKLIAKHWALLSAFGFFGVVGFTVPYYVGLQYTVAVNASLMNASGTLWILGTTFLMTGETITKRQTLGVLLGLLGTLLIVLKADPSTLSSFRINIGDILVLVAFFAWAVYTVMLRWKPAGMGELSFLTSMTAFSVVMMFPLWLWELAQGKTFEWDADNSSIIAYAVIFPSFLAYIVWNKAVPVVGASIAGMTQYSIPIFGTILSVAILGESIRTYHLVGIAVIFTGIWLVTSGRRRTAPQTARTTTTKEPRN